MTAQEKAIHEFYEWEIRYRGYECYSFPVEQSVPYTPFIRNTPSSYPDGYDDGVSPTILGGLKKMFSSNVEENITTDIDFPDPEKTERNESLSVILVSFIQGAQIYPENCREFLNILSFARYPISFEIIGTANDITIQFVCNEYDEMRVYANLQAYFPEASLKPGGQFDLPFDYEVEKIKVVDFGLSRESMLPLKMADSFKVDPLTSIFGILDSIGNGNIIVFQMIVEAVDDPIAHDIMNAVTDGNDESFFGDLPELPNIALEKVQSPLTYTVMRIAVQSENEAYSQYLAKECIMNICATTEGEYNNLIPLPNEGYDYKQHVMNLFCRSSNRTGMLLSVNELVTLMHYPNNTVFSPKLFDESGQTKAVPKIFTDKTYTLGTNIHDGIETDVTVDNETRLKHTHILGVTGVGKSTLLVNLMLQDIENGNGCALFDPHGDIVDDILLRIPKNRADDIILIDPSDTDFPVGFNLLHATTEAEKLVLSSDLVSAFRNHSTAWGDTMTSVLSNAIDTFLNSSTGGTLIELKKFLLDDTFRKSFLLDVDDPSLKYYWRNEYRLVKKRISPLLTRIDTFLRPKIIRMMMAQKSGIDFHTAIAQKKIILFKLSLGLIGEENAYLLGSLFLSKLNQVALGRQSLKKAERHSYFIYLDECQHFLTPSIGMMLSGVRKYGIGLVLAHQDLSQIEHIPTLNSILSNPFTRICFRLGDSDAKRLSSGFSYFEADDLTSLDRGHTIARFGSSDNDCNMHTQPLSEKINEEFKEYIISHSRGQYAQPRKVVEGLINQQYEEEVPSTINPAQETVEEISTTPITFEPIPLSEPEEAQKDEISEKIKNEFIEQEEKKENLREHRKLQANVKRLGQQFGFRSSIEKEIQDGKRIDVSLERDDLMIACEISVTNTAKYEISNIKKCLDSNYDLVLVLSDKEKHLSTISTMAQKILSQKQLKQTLFISSEDLLPILESTRIEEKPPTEVIKGFRVKTEFDSNNSNEANRFRKNIEHILKKKR